jgi:hypothetical protein
MTSAAAGKALPYLPVPPLMPVPPGSLGAASRLIGRCLMQRLEELPPGTDILAAHSFPLKAPNLALTPYEQ